jgi:N-methylhydantoinase A
VVAPPLMRVGVDVGGTFTDLAGLGDDGGIRVIKVPSTPDDPARALWRAVDALGGAPVAALLHGTTVATNALLERRGGRVVFVTTRGFEDLLWLRRQERAALYDLARDHPSPVVSRDDVVGAAERMGPSGVIEALTPAEIARVVAAVRERRPAAIAVGLLFSFRHPAHERALAAALTSALPGTPVVASSELLPVFREYERFGTTTAEAFLRPLVAGYVERLGQGARERAVGELRIMASNGGTLAPAQACRRATALALSGPAGGVEGARLVGRALDEPNLLTLDMGGTSADASVVIDGEALMQGQGDVGGIPLALPHVLIETVGAGGGSIGWVDAGGALRVGPRSAGAEPGPACYGRGGTEATVTDAALVLGWLDAEMPLASGLRLDPDAAHRAVESLSRRAALPLSRCAEGMVEVATATMVRALRRVSVERGLDPRHMTLVPFGGAGPLFTCRLAESLGMRRAAIPPHPGVLSALGLAVAPARVEQVASLHRNSAGLDRASWDAAFAPVERAVRDELPRAALARVAECRYPGQGYELTVAADAGPASIAARFHEVHRERFGYADAGREVEVVNVRVVGTSRGPADRRTGGPDLVAATGEAGRRINGPATVALADATVRIEEGWSGVVHSTGAIIVERDGPPC